MEVEGCDFARTRISGVDYVCSCGKALANCWNPTPEEDQAEIPEVIIANGCEYKVEFFAGGIFSKSVIRAISIPKTVRFLPKKCFECCENLEIVTFEPESQVFLFGKACFKRCGLSKIEFPDSCISIGSKCFDGCVKLRHVGISERSQLSRIGDFAFRGCNISDFYLANSLELGRNSMRSGIFLGVKSVNIGTNRNVLMYNDCLMYNDRSMLIHCFSQNSTFEVPDSAVGMWDWCFAGSEVRKVVFRTDLMTSYVDTVFSGSYVEEIVCQQIQPECFVKDGMVFHRDTDDNLFVLYFRMGRTESMKIDPYVKSINRHFCGALDPLKIVRFDTSCKDLTIPDATFKDMGIIDVALHGMKTLPSQCFYRCKFLKNVSFSSFSTVTDFGRKSFSMTGLEHICVPRSVQNIGAKCFAGCRLLKEITFEEGSRLQSIGEKAFMNTSLSFLVVPSGVDIVTGTSFYGVDDIVCSPDGFLSINDGFLIHDETQCLVAFLGGASDDVVIPSRIRVIGSQSFYRCGHIKTLSFEDPSEIDCIEDDAFKYCQIDQLHIPRHLSSLGRGILNHVSSIVIDEGNAWFNWTGGSLVTRVVDAQSVHLMGVVGVEDVIHVPDYVSSISSICNHGKRGFVLSFAHGDLCAMRTLGASAFKGSDIISVSFPPRTKSIADNCFENCEFLFSVSFHGSCLKSLGSRCFAGTSISKITIPSSLEVLPAEAFAECVNLVEVDFEENSRLRVIGESCFRGCLNLCVLVPPDTVRIINNQAFWECPITEFRFPSSLNELGSLCFSTHLEKISSLCDLEIQQIPAHCFEECQLRSVEIPAFVLTIQSSAFRFCQVLETVTFERGSQLHVIGKAAFYRTAINEIVFPSSLRSIHDDAFRATKLREVSLPEGLTELGSNAFGDCDLLRVVSFENCSLLTKIEGTNVFDGTTGCHIAIPASLVHFPGSFLPTGCSVSISEENPSYVCDDRFVYNTDRTQLVRYFGSEPSVVIPRTVQCIGSECFERCGFIRNISFEEGSELKTIETGAFTHLELPRLVLPKSLVSFPAFAFWKCWLGTLAFEEGSKLKNVPLLHTRVDSLILPESAEDVEVCKLSEVPVGVRHVDVHMKNPHFSCFGKFLLRNQEILFFMFDMEVLDVVVPKFVRVLLRQSFRPQVKSITFESDSKLLFIGYHALTDTSIERFVVPGSVRGIKDGAFYGCKLLKELIFEEDCAIEKLSRGMFEGTNLQSLSIPAHVKDIEPRMLFGIKNVSISPKNPYLTYKSDVFKIGCGISLLGSFDDEGIFVFDSNVEAIPDNEFLKNTLIGEVFVSHCSSLRSIGAKAFSESSLCSISIPWSVRTLGESCFHDCQALNSVQFSSGSCLGSLSEWCFAGTCITSISIPSSVKVIERGCFCKSRLVNVIFPPDSCLERLEESAFSETQLVRVIVPKSVVFLGKFCFKDCSRLVSVSFESRSNLRHIDQGCFQGCKLDEIVIPAKVAKLGPESLTGIENIEIDRNNPNFYFEEPFLFSMDGLAVKAYFSRRSELTIPDFVEVLEADCFASSSISCVRFANQSRLRVIGDQAFFETQIRSLTIPKSVQIIGEKCCAMCTKLSTVQFDSDCDPFEIGQMAFIATGVTMMDFRKVRRVTELTFALFAVSRLTKVIVSKNIEFIHAKCFLKTDVLSEVVFEDGSILWGIDFSAFEESAIQSICLPGHVREIGARAFRKCANLREVKFDDLTPLMRLRESLFEKSTIASIRIPENVVIIEASCFDGCSSLSDLIFPDESCLREIGRCAFRETALERVCLPRDVRILGDKCFAHCSHLKRFEFVDDAHILAITGRDVLKGVEGCMICIPDRLCRFDRSFIPDGCFVSVSPKNTNFACDGQFIFNGKQDKLIYCLNDTSCVTIPRGVRVIQKHCFRNRPKLNEIHFEPGSCLHKIGVCAFSPGCISEERQPFTRVILPRSVKVFKFAFKGCVIERLEFEEGCDNESIDDLGCKVIHELVVPNGTKMINLKTLACSKRVISASETSLLNPIESLLVQREQNALVFMLNPEIVDVVVPKFVRVLKSHCFYNSRQIESITFESDSDLRVIESYAIQDTSIERFVVPRLVDTIQDRAFSGCESLKRLIFEEDCVIKSLTCGMFEDLYLRSLFISSNVENIEPRSLFSIKQVSISPKNPHIHSESDVFKLGCGISASGCWSSHYFCFKREVEAIPDNEFLKNRRMVLFDYRSIRSIGKGAFANSSLCGIPLKKSLRSLGEFCFSYSNLAWVAFSKKSCLECLPESCFEGTRIESISIPNCVKVIGQSCFYSCQKLQSVSFADNSPISLFPDFLFCRTAIDSITVPRNVREIGFQCFANSQLSSLNFADGTCLKVIANEAFRNTRLTSVTLPKTVIEIGDMCFSGICDLSTFVFCEGSELRRIGSRCFKGSSVEEIEVPPLVSEIEFQGLSDIGTVAINPKNSHFVCDNSFLLSRDGFTVHGCLEKKINHMNIPPEAVRVVDGAFMETEIVAVVMPNTLVSLGSESFCGCETLEEVEFSRSNKLERIGKRCFAECRLLTDVSVANLLHLRSLPEEMFLHTRIEFIHVPKSVRAIQSRCFARCARLSRIEFEVEGRLKRIFDEAFRDCGLVNVHFPKSLAALGDRAFSGCSNLKSVSFAPNSSIEFIGSNCFQSQCSIELPDTIYMIKKDSFGCDCEVVMASDDEAIRDEFGTWIEQRDHSFVNPTRRPNEIIKGALHLCDGGVIGSGGQGVVKVKRNMITGEILAVKVIDYRTFRGEFTESMWNEMKSREQEMEELNHPCLVKVKGCCFDDNRRCITVCMDYIKGPSLDASLSSKFSSVNLKNVLENRPSWWTRSALCIVFLGIARGLDYIHNRSLVHRDLKPSNVLIDEEFHPKICDFDVGRRVDEFDDSGSMTIAIGTLKYMAPECSDGKYSSRSDYYSFGVLLYEMFEGLDSTSQSRVTLSDLCFSDKTPEKIREFIRDCLATNPQERCKFECYTCEDLDHPLFSVLYCLVRDHMNLDSSELMSVDAFVEKLERDEASENDFE